MSGVDILKHIVNPWHEGLRNPDKAQQNLLKNLLEGYKKTDYGKIHTKNQIHDSLTFRNNFPIIDYNFLREGSQ